MTRFEEKSKKERFAIWLRTYILGINIINILGAIFTPDLQGFMGIFLLCTGLLAVHNAFNKKLNVTFLNKGYALINFLVGMFTTYIGGMLIYTTIIGG